MATAKQIAARKKFAAMARSKSKTSKVGRAAASTTKPKRKRRAKKGCAVAAKRTYKRDKRGRFASSGSTRAKRVSRKISRRRPRYVRGSVGKTVRVGRVGPGNEYVGIHAGVKLRTRKHRAEYYVGVSAGRRIAMPY
jgi:hypothetical protein